MEGRINGSKEENNQAPRSNPHAAYLHLSILGSIMQGRPSPVVLEHLGPHTQETLQDSVVPSAGSKMQGCRPLLILARQADVCEGGL